jgi:hypothetical protein
MPSSSRTGWKKMARIYQQAKHDPLATPSGQALVSRPLQRQIVLFKVLIDESELSHMPEC